MTGRQFGWPAFATIAIAVATILVAAYAVSIGAPARIAVLVGLLSGSLLFTLLQAYRSEEGLLSVRGVFAAFFLLTFVGRPLQILRDGQSIWTVDRGAIESYLAVALLLVQLGVLAYLFGYQRGWNTLARHLPLPPPLVRSKVSIGRLILLAGFGAAGMAALVGNPFVWVSRLFFRRELLEGRFYLYSAALVLPFSLLALAAVVLGERKRVTGILLVLGAAASLALLGGRSAVVFAIFAGAALYDRHVHRIRAVAIAGLACVVAAFLVAYLDFRVSARGVPTQTPVTAGTHSNSIDHTLNAGFTGVDRFLVLLEGVPGTIPFQFGATYARIVTAPIPRRWWPDKPGISEATVYAPLFGTNTGMYPASFVGDLYLNGHVIAVLLGMCLMGMIHRALDVWRFRHGKNPSVTILYAIGATTIGAGLGNVGIVNALLMALPFFAVTLVAHGSGNRWIRSL